MGLAEKSIKSTFYITTGNFFVYGINFSLGIVLARKISPVYFGIYAVGILYYAIIERFNCLGFNEALRVSKDDLMRTGETHRFLCLCQGLFGLLIAILLKYSLEYFEVLAPEAGWVMVFIACMKIFELYILTPKLMMEKELRYARLSAVQVLVSPVSLSLQIYLAYYFNMALFAIVAGTFASTLIRIVMYSLINPFGRIRPQYHKDIAKFLWNFGPAKLYYFSSWGSLLLMKFDDFCVERLTNLQTFAFYGKAFHWASLPTTKIATSLSGTAFSVFAKTNEDIPQFRTAFSHFMGINLRVICLVSGLLFLACPTGIPLLLGPAWTGMVPIMQALVIYCAIRPTCDMSGTALTTLGQQSYVLKLNFLQAALIIVLALPLTYFYSAVGAGISTSITILIISLVLNNRLYQKIKMRWHKIYIPPFLFMIISIACVTFFPEKWLKSMQAPLIPLLDFGSLGTYQLKLFTTLLINTSLFTSAYLCLSLLFEGKLILRTLRKGLQTIKKTT